MKRKMMDNHIRAAYPVTPEKIQEAMQIAKKGETGKTERDMGNNQGFC